MSVVILAALAFLLPCVEAVEISSEASGEENEAITCEQFCRQLPSAGGVCKRYTRTLPRPRVGRACTLKFREAFDIYCPLLCLAGGEEGYLSPWIERLSQSSCQNMSSHIPYPVVFNSCKTGYRNGFTAARTAVSKRFGRRGGRDINDGNMRVESSTNPESGTVHPLYQDIDKLNVAAALSSTAEVDATSPKKENFQTLGDVGDLMESLDTPPGYIDYAIVAKERVSAARRTSGSDLQRGPACSVCSG